MKIDCKVTTVSGPKFGDPKDIKQLTIVKLIWKLIKIFFRYRNAEIYYHLPHPDSYSCPFEAENVEIRHTLTGPKVTIW